jgi:glutamate-1-semialdehyde 2,1-aminomutase
MTTLAIVQARMGSTRFPGKVLQELPGGHSLISFLLARLSQCAAVDRIVVATTDRESDDRFAGHVRQLGYEVFRGSDKDVLDRYYHAALPHAPTVVVRITGDCPLVDPALVTRVITVLTDQQADYAANNHPPTYPDGLDVEACTFGALERA